MPLTADQLIELANERALAVPNPGSKDIAALDASYTDHHSEHKRRLETLGDILKDKWDEVFPDASRRIKAPKVANTIRTDLGQVARTAGGPVPTLIVDADSETDTAQTEASKRQRIAETYRARSRLHRIRPETVMDLAAGGLAGWAVYPDFAQAERDPATAFPLIIRKNPRYILPDPSWEGGEEISDVICSRLQKASILERAFPAEIDDLLLADEKKKKHSTWVRVIEFYDENWTIKVAAMNKRNVELARIPNLVGRPMFVLGTRLEYDGEFRGQFDSAIGPLVLANEMVAFKMEDMANKIWANRIIYGQAENTSDFGPGADIYAGAPEEFSIEYSVPPGVDPQYYADLSDLRDQARVASGVSTAARGDLPQSIISAAGVNALRGPDTEQVEEYLDTLAHMERRALSLCFAVDENYLDDQKIASGISEGKSFREKYRPSRAINGRYDIRVEYGEGSGLDKLNRQNSVIARHRAGLMSKRDAMVQLNEGGDVQAQQRQMEEEAIRQSVLAGLLLPDTPMQTRLKAIEMFNQGKDLPEIAAELLAAPEPEQPDLLRALGQQVPEEPQRTEARSRALERGGIPGNAEQLQAAAPGAEGLPPLEEVMGL